MDWYLPGDFGDLADLRGELRGLLQRHSVEGSDVDAALLVASELVTNAIEHSTGAVWVSLDWGAARPVLSVRDLGAEFVFDPASADPQHVRPSGRGLRIVAHLVPSLVLAARASGGTLAQAVLPVERPPAVPIDPPRRRVGPSLPHLDERRSDGTFGRESFLRALVVQLAQTTELAGGPTLSESVVAEVGGQVGAQMEAAYRAAHDVAGDLEVDEIASLLVELKRAIDGDFFVVDATDERIVLGNHRCPFGDAVRLAPSLCRMTSSVFGGIARRNRGAAAVDIEERIAVGDPQCRVTVWLRRPPEDRRPFVHAYGTWDETGPTSSGEGRLRRADWR